MFFRVISYKFYTDKSDYDRLVFRQLYASNSHHVIITILVLRSYMASSSECEGYQNYMWFTDKVCFNTVDKQFVKNTMVTLAYLLYDFILLMFFFKKERAITR